MRLIASSVGTGEGKTWFSRGLARALSRRGHRVAALKPFETGVTSQAADARSLERACGAGDLAFESPAFFRCRPAVSPHAAALSGPAADLGAIRVAIADFQQTFGIVLVESAGGLFVPVGSPLSPLLFVDLLQADDVLFIVAANRLGVLSNVLAAVRALPSGLGLRPIIVLSGAVHADESSATNAAVLRDHSLDAVEWGGVAVDDDDVLAESLEGTGLVERVLLGGAC